MNTDTEQKENPGSGLDIELEGGRERGKKEGVVEYALRVLGIDKRDANYESNYRTFSKFLMKLGTNGTLDLIDEVKSQIRQGEWATVNNPPAMFIRRIKSRLGLVV